MNEKVYLKCFDSYLCIFIALSVIKAGLHYIFQMDFEIILNRFENKWWT